MASLYVSIWKLELKFVQLIFSKTGLASILIPSNLWHLILFRCHNPGIFLRSLCELSDDHGYRFVSINSFTNLRTLQIDHTGNEDDDHFLSHLNRVLNHNTVYLQVLWLHLRGYDHLPEVSGIAMQSSSLRVLSLHVRDWNEHAPTWTSDDFRWLCTKLPKLEHLGLALPPAELGESIEKQATLVGYLVRLLVLTQILTA